MNKKMFIICAVFALIISCKNYVSSKDLGNLEQNVEGKVKGFLDTKKEELTEGIKKLGSEVSSKVKEELMQADGQPQGQVEEQVFQGADEDLKLKEEIEKKIKELKEKLKDKLKGKEEDKKKLEDELETLEKTLKEIREKRKKELEEAQKEFAKLKEQAESTTGVTQGDQAKGKGIVGAQAWSKAKKLGLNVSYSSDNGTDSNDFAKKVIGDSLKRIDEELNNSIEDGGEV